jgi:Mg2+ and Co2+ transporter CorA
MMSAIYNLIAQKESNIGLRVANHSRTLAIESKRDSSSMKTIAAVTMAFLPGAFVASFFAMPMFDWNKPPGHNVNTHTFWIYWTVTIPLTASVFCCGGHGFASSLHER